jgi:hypothetical protein
MSDDRRHPNQTNNDPKLSTQDSPSSKKAAPHPQPDNHNNTTTKALQKWRTMECGSMMLSSK